MNTNASNASTPPEPTVDGRRHVILGTAGHIDHGKTALVRALTGVDTDRLPEEKQRGMTIDLGFAALTVEDVHFGIVDVPGHERFVRTMVAGASGIDIALLVVAADDSVMPQTREHVEILDLLGVSRGVVAITKTDLVDEDMVALVADEVGELLAPTGLGNAPIVPLSSLTGLGLDALQRALHDIASDVPTLRADGPFRMAVDRAFTVRGRGTVVTGSVLHGTVQPGDSLVLWPAGLSCRVRGLQSHGQPAVRLHGGQRAALNLIGADRARIFRGCELAAPGLVVPTQTIDVRFDCLPTASRPVRANARVSLCMGTREVPARLVPLDGNVVQPGERAFAQLRTAAPVTAGFGQRFIVRDASGTRTVGGGRVLRAPSRRRRRPGDAEGLAVLDGGAESARVEEALRFAGFDRLDALQLVARTGLSAEHTTDIIQALSDVGRRRRIAETQHFATVATLETFDRRAVDWLDRFHHRHPDEPGCLLDVFVGYLERKSAPGLGRALFERLLVSGRVKTMGRYAALAGFGPALSAQDEEVLKAIVDEYDRAAFQPPAVDALRIARQTSGQRVKKLIKMAVATGALVRVDAEILLHRRHEERMRDIVAEMIRAANGEGVTVSAVRGRLESTRRFVVPMLEYLDRIRFTRRVGDRRVLARDEGS